VLDVKNVTRKYQEFTAVSDASFNIKEGEIVGLLGHNGAGKTTIMKMITGYLEPNAGRIKIDGMNIGDNAHSFKTKIGYLPENCPVYLEMTVLEYLNYCCDLRDITENERSNAIYKAIKATDLFEKASEPIGKLSRGLRQRVGVAQAILHSPKLIVLDEPTNGLDPTQINQMRRLIKSLAQTATIILSTHILQEVEAVCSRVIIINRGKIVKDTSLSELKSNNRIHLVTSLPPTKLIKIMNENFAIAQVSEQDHGHLYQIATNGSNPRSASVDLSKSIVSHGGDLIEIHPLEENLESIFSQISSGKPVMMENTNV